MPMLQFDAATTRLLENAYRGSDVVKRRLATLEALAPEAGEVIVDVGSGQGYLTLELARAVGETGEVIAVDPSPDMRRAAASQCNGLSNVRILDGRATDLPLADASAARAASLQVFEYLDDIPSALAEIRRVLRPAGRFSWRLALGQLDMAQLRTGTYGEDDARMGPSCCGAGRPRETAAYDARGGLPGRNDKAAGVPRYCSSQ